MANFGKFQRDILEDSISTNNAVKRESERLANSTQIVLDEVDRLSQANTNQRGTIDSLEEEITILTDFKKNQAEVIDELTVRVKGLEAQVKEQANQLTTQEAHIQGLENTIAVFESSPSSLFDGIQLKQAAPGVNQKIILSTVHGWTNVSVLKLILLLNDGYAIWEAHNRGDTSDYTKHADDLAATMQDIVFVETEDQLRGIT